MKAKIKPLLISSLLIINSLCVAAENKPVVLTTQQQLDAINKSQQGLEIKTHANGSRSVDLEGRFQMYSKAIVVDGKIQYTCNDHPNLETHHTHTDKKLQATKRGVK